VWAKSIGSAGMFTFGAVGYVCSRKSEALLPATQAKEALDSQLVDEIAAHEFVLRTRGLIQYQSPALPEYSGDRPIDESGWSAPGDYPSSDSIQLFDWQRFNTERNEFPHILIAGKTGGGKSTLAEYLASLFDGIVIAVAPHWTKGDFTSADLVIGWGRNEGEAVDFKYSFAEILTGQINATVGEFMGALFKEMDRRYTLTPTQERVGDNEEPITVILDEFNMYANMENLPPITSKLLREARKVGIRIIVLAQGTEVEALGCKGQGQIRESFTYILVKNKAKEYADLAVKKAYKSPYENYARNVKTFIENTPFSCFVEDQPALIPDLTGWKKQQPPLAKLAGFGVQQKTSVCEPDPFADGSCTDAQVADLSTEVCPNCGSEDVRTNGKTSSGATRYRCKSCDKSWSEK
jgi:predicted RNA-binding Zn-ribbon protein involved in translation (DUF1610 family)/energy-coupling factor transporter ATP-binding protein EcfA2